MDDTTLVKVKEWARWVGINGAFLLILFGIGGGVLTSSWWWFLLKAMVIINIGLVLIMWVICRVVSDLLQGMDPTPEGAKMVLAKPESPLPEGFHIGIPRWLDVSYDVVFTLAWLFFSGGSLWAWVYAVSMAGAMLVESYDQQVRQRWINRYARVVETILSIWEENLPGARAHLRKEFPDFGFPEDDRSYL